MTKPERERRAKEIIRESGADTEEHFRRVQAVNLGTTFKQQAEYWIQYLQTRKRRPVKAHTVQTWGSHLKWINQKIGGAPLASVNNRMLKDLISDMAAAGFSARTMKCYAGVVKQVVASAINDDGEQIHPRKWNHDFLDLPEVKEPNTPAFTPEQVSRILAADSPYRTLYALLAGTGMRIGEALGLEVSHISADGRTLSIRQTLWAGLRQPPKTRNSFREIDLHPDLSELLLSHINGRQDGFVFLSARGTPLQPAHVLRLDLHPILKAIGATKAGYHAFRRYRVTHLRKQRVPEDLIRFWIGHADKSITDGYSKVKEDREFRLAVASNVPLGFELPAKTVNKVNSFPLETVQKPDGFVPNITAKVPKEGLPLSA